MIKNSMLRSVVMILFAGLHGVACTSSGSTPADSSKSKTNAPPRYVHIDLGKHRPKLPVPSESLSNAPKAKPSIIPTHHQNQRVNARLDSIAEANWHIRYAQGYRILVYSGNERKQAMEVRKAVSQRLPQEPEYFTYQQPTFRLKIGDYLTRLEARYVLSQLQDIAPGATLVAEQIYINK